MAETQAARPRREQEGFFDKYCQGRGIDIGCGDDPVTPEVERWDLSLNPIQDATLMPGIKDASYDFVHSSHCLEHLIDPWTALRNWWRILKPGGYLILLLPHRDLYEKKKNLPSVNNPDHKYFYLPTWGEGRSTLSLAGLLNETCGDYDLIRIAKCEQYSFECIIRKEE